MGNFIDITEKEKKEYNSTVSHPLQSFEWGEFRKKTGIKVIRRGQYNKDRLNDCFTLTIHKIPNLPFTIGYLPKGNLPSNDLLQELKEIGGKENCIFIQLEPNVIQNTKYEIPDTLIPSSHPLFTKHTLVLDLTKSEDELLKSFHSKTRYNIRLAQKQGVTVTENNSKSNLQTHLKLMAETTKRQKFYAHTPIFHKLQWELFDKDNNKNKLTYHLLQASFKDENKKVHILTSWVLYIFHDTLYYPYGASTTKFKSLMSSNLMMWEAIRFGKKMNLKKFDMWGSLGENPDPKDPWFGFHKFKLGYNPELVEFIGSYDLIINPKLYQIFKVADKARWMILRLKKF